MTRCVIPGDRETKSSREGTGRVLARLYPQDQTRNASGLRRSLDPVSSALAAPEPMAATPVSTIPPLLARLPRSMRGNGSR